MTQIDPNLTFSAPLPLRVGLVGTGYVSKIRASILQNDSRAKLVAVAGHLPETTATMAQSLGIDAAISWRKLIEREDIDLVIIANVNVDHGPIARAAMENGKHVIVEYPLALDAEEGEKIINLAAKRNLLLHVEHIELLGGLHNAIKQYLPVIGQVFYARYITITKKNPAPLNWSYQKSLFGFPLIGALSRVQRFTDLFGTIKSINCHTTYWDRNADFFSSVFCHAQLKFSPNLLGEIIYGKGENFGQSENQFTLYGEQGTLIMTPEKGELIQGENRQIIEIPTRQGLFAKDTTMVLDHLFNGTPLYTTPQASLYALKIAQEAARSSSLNQTIYLEEHE